MRVAILDPSGNAAPGVILSPRHVAVAKLLLTGLSLKEIAYTLAMADSTLRSHLERIAAQLAQPGRGRLNTRSEISQWLYSYPHVLQGCVVPPVLHPDNCSCPAPFCTVQRIRDARFLDAGAFRIP